MLSNNKLLISTGYILLMLAASFPVLLIALFLGVNSLGSSDGMGFIIAIVVPVGSVFVSGLCLTSSLVIGLLTGSRGLLYLSILPAVALIITAALNSDNNPVVAVGQLVFSFWPLAIYFCLVLGTTIYHFKSIQKTAKTEFK